MLTKCNTCKFWNGVINGYSTFYECTSPEIIKNYNTQVKIVVIGQDFPHCNYSPKDSDHIVNKCRKCKHFRELNHEEAIVENNKVYHYNCRSDLAIKSVEGGRHMNPIFNGGFNWCTFELKEDSTVQLANNQGREICFKCNTKTVKVSTGFYSVYDICPICKI